MIPPKRIVLEDLNNPDTKGMSQNERVLVALKAFNVVCGVTFLRMGVPRYAARVHDLRSKGHVIEKVKCPYTSHSHGKQIASYRYLGRA